MKMTKIPPSTCCNAEVKTDCGDEGTCCFLCTACGKACNPNYGESTIIGESINYKPTEPLREVTKEIDPNYDARYRQGYEDGVAKCIDIINMSYYRSPNDCLNCDCPHHPEERNIRLIDKNRLKMKIKKNAGI